MIFFTSDTHFFAQGKAVTDFGYHDVKKLLTHIQKNWNAKVNPEDTVYHLGDLFSRSLRTNLRAVVDYLNSLNGQMYLIHGNYDSGSEHVLDHTSIIRLPELYELDTGLLDFPLVLCHYPLYRWNNDHQSSIHLYGHVHGTISRQYQLEHPLAFDVGLMNSKNFTPFSLDEILRALHVK